MKNNRFDIFNWYYLYKEYLREYFAINGKYPDKQMIGEIIMMDTVGVISADDGIQWISPDGNYRFEVVRRENQLWMTDNGSKYIMSLKIFSSLGNMISEIRFNELDAIRIIDCSINAFLNEFYSYNDSMMIYINPNNPRMITNIIEIRNIMDEEPHYQAYSINGTEIEEITVKFLQYSSATENIIPMVLMKLSVDQFEDFFYKMFFCTIMDIDLNSSCKEALDIIESNTLF